MSISSVMTVCVGNICRSPMAQVLLAQALPGVQVYSAGIEALVGHPADPLAIELMRERQLDLGSHRAVQVNAPMCQQAGLILVMDNGQRRFLEERFPQVCGKVFRLGQFSQQSIPDPYRKPREAFVQALELIDQGVRDWSQRIQAL